MSLREYRRKRDFRVTAEPKGRVERASAGGAGAFVVQKHAASRLHYDFRLELDGVLKSWAVPKGPSLDPKARRLAVHVEDHPVAYGDFEGTIPAGEYGGGTVLLWDRGTWEPLGDARKDYAAGRLKFRLHGERLRGAWMLVRTGSGAEDGEKSSWLLIKERDEESKPESDYSITSDKLDSVESGRTMEVIAADEGSAVWHSNRGSEEQSPAPPTKAKRKEAPRKRDRDAESAGEPLASGARRVKMAAAYSAQLATLVDMAPAGDDWIHEVKLDGYRLLCTVRGGTASLITRKGNDWTKRFPWLARALEALPAKDFVIDGEVVVLLEDGTTSFQSLQNAIGRTGKGPGDERMTFFAFDLLHLEGWDLRPASLLDRKSALASLLADAEDRLRFSDHVVGRGEAFYRQACDYGLEGIISKRADAPYRPRRTDDWRKVKCMRRQEFVIGGWTDPRGSRQHFGALLLGVHDEDGRLRYAGKVGTGFDEARLASIQKQLKKLAADGSPFADFGSKAAEKRGSHWVRPDLVAEVSFGEWTSDGLIRHGSFQGLREDKPASAVVREEPVSIAKAEAASKPAPETSAAKRKSASPPPSTRPAAPRRRGHGANTEVGGVRLTNPEKVLFPEQGLTKRDLAEYYEAVAEWMLPHVGSRPLTLVRCPEGRGKQCFYQKHADERFPPEIRRVLLHEEDADDVTYTYVDSAAGLIALVQLGVLEVHTWNARVDKPERPDRFILDLDPANDVPWKDVVASAFEVRERLESLGLRSWVKTTGGKGLHVVVPISRRYGWDEVKEFSKALAVDLTTRSPGRYTAKSTLAKREGKIYLDYLRNGRGSTAISAFSVRARPGAPISVPLTWEELTPKIRAADFSTEAVLKRLRALKEDPWKDFYGTTQSITAKMKSALGLR